MIRLTNAALAYATLDHIDANPDEWNQERWICGTGACYAGHAVMIAGGTIEEDPYSALGIVTAGPALMVGESVQDAAYMALGITMMGATVDDEWLFAPSNSREDLGRLVEAIFGPRPTVTA